MTAPVGRLGLWRTVGYSVGDFAFNLFFTFCNLFLLYFYTDVLGLQAGVAGGIIMVALVVEGVFDPLMGVIANRTRSRFGRYRPWLLFGALPLCLSFVAMFAPLGLKGGALVGYTLVTHLVFRLLYTVVGVPYAALSAQMTADSRERSQLAGSRMMFAMLCGLTLAAGSLPLVHALGGGHVGFFRMSLCSAALALAIFAVCWLSTREDPSATLSQPHPLQAWRALLRNPPFLMVTGALTTASIGSTASSKSLVYYVKYVVGSEALVTPALTVGVLVATCLTPVWMLLTPRLGKRRVWLAGAATATLQGVAFYLLRPTGPLLLVVVGLSGVSLSAIALTFWSMLPDTVEYGEFRAGVRVEGAIYGMATLAQKVALGIGVGFLGVLLDLIGYRPNAVQAPSTLEGLRVLATLVPAGLAALGGLIVWRYPLDWRLHARLRRALDRRRARLATAAAPGLPG